MKRGRLANRLLDAPLRWLATAIGLVVLAVSGVAGGLSTGKPAGDPQVKVGQVSRGGPWNVTVLGARVVNDLSPIKPQKDGDRWFIVLATVEVTADESRTDAVDAITVSGVPGLLTQKAARVLVARDGSEPRFLNPGMPEKLGFVWEQSGTVPLPTTATVQIWGKTLRADSLTGTATATGRKDWLDRKVRAVAQTPVQDKRT